MRETRTSGSVEGVLSNEHPYSDWRPESAHVAFVLYKGGIRCRKVQGRRNVLGPGLQFAEVDRESDLTDLLQTWSQGDAQALEQLEPLVHRQLREMARRMLASERLADGWQPTDLVHGCTCGCSTGASSIVRTGRTSFRPRPA
jgi:hypothetical protein